MPKQYELSHIVFMELIRTIVTTVGEAPAKGSLMRIALQAGDHCEEMTFQNFDEFVASFTNNGNPISHIEGEAVHIGDGIFGLKKCPFSSLIGSYKDFYGDIPRNFNKLTDEFNTPSRITEEHHVGAGSGVGPFCIFHQPIRSKIGSKITIGSKKIEVVQLGCRTGEGKKAFSDSLISFFNTTKDKVDEVLGSYVCCYGIRELN